MEHPAANEPGNEEAAAHAAAAESELPAHDIPMTVDHTAIVVVPEPEPAPLAVEPPPAAAFATHDEPVHDAPSSETPSNEAPSLEAPVPASAVPPQIQPAEVPHIEAAAVADPSLENDDIAGARAAFAIDPPLEAATEPSGEAEPIAAESESATPGDPARVSSPRTLGIDPAVAERKKRAQEAWDRVVAAKENNTLVEGTVTSAVKGGFLIEVDGVRGFLPASQAAGPEGTAPEAFVKTKVSLKVLDVDVARKRIVASHRRAAESARRAARSNALRDLAVGQRHEATAMRLAPFGAFVDIGNGIEGLVPMSELAFERVEKVEDVMAVGDTFPVTVLRIEDRGKKIAFSRKNALPDPWRDHADVVRIGASIEGKVVGKEPRLQVEIAPGIVGAVRESDADPNDYEIGELVEVTIRNLDRRTRRITLTTAHAAAAAATMTTNTRSGFAPLGEELRRRNK